MAAWPCRYEDTAASASGASSVRMGSPRLTESPSLTSTEETRPASGSDTRDMRFGLASILPGETTSPEGTDAVRTSPVRISASLGERAGITSVPSGRRCSVGEAAAAVGDSWREQEQRIRAAAIPPQRRRDAEKDAENNTLEKVGIGATLGFGAEEAENVA